jgi:quinohemoprotein ethanol dehydrogenase
MQPYRLARDLAAIATFIFVSAAALPREPAGNVTDARVAADTSGDNWLVKGGGFAQQQFSPLRQITDKNVGKLGLAWVTEFNEPMGLVAEPIVVDGIVYLSAPRSIVYAIDAATGKIIWTFDPHVRLDLSIDNSSDARANRGVAVWAGKVYVGTADGRLVAIDAAKGTQLWASPVCDPTQSGITGAPRVARGKVFIGYSGADEQVRGSLAAFDVETGKELWRFWTVPGNPTKGFESKALEMAAKTWLGSDSWRQGGGTVWEPITFDATTGLLLFGTSKSFRDEGTAGQQSAAGAKLFSGSIVAVRADSGQYVWHYQTSTPLRQTENFHIVLADIAIGGRTRHVAMTAARNGTFYVLDAATGQLISQQPMVRQERLSPAAGLAGEQMDYPGVVVRGVEDCPGGGCFGVRNWWPMSYNPVTQLTYLPIMDRRRSGGVPEALPMVGRLVAWDPKTQGARWSVEHPIIVNSGVLSTAGNLVFQGQGTGEFAAYAADSGEKLWSIQTGSAINAVPVTFRFQDDQYVIVPVGWGSGFRLFAPSSMMVTPESKYGPSRLLAFKLGATNAFPFPHIPTPEVPRPPAQTFSRNAVKRGEELADSHNCTGCHSPRLDGSGRWIVDGGVPDLRYMPPDAHRDWHAIVLGGSHRTQGMMPFGVPTAVPSMPALSASEADDIHAYVIDRAWAAYDEQQRERKAQGAAP